MKRGCLIVVILVILVLLCASASVGYILLAPTTAKPAVLINSPRDGAQVGVGQATFIHAIARGDAQQKIKRVEVWIDGALHDAQTTSVPGGLASFPLSVTWRAGNPGAHQILVRAFNASNTRGSASINLEAVASADRDGDGIADALDNCPDQPGLPAHNGCPAPTPDDRDGDGIRDASDACPDQPGTTLASGCPDADGDGIRDSADACPREFGVPERNGCPNPGDTDGDGIADASDACPDQPGTTLASGCPDADGDGIRDSADACPREFGVPERNGCPNPGDTDGDGIADASDACPREPGQAETGGCPDRDGDRVRDADDACPDAPGLPGLRGCPDRDGDGVRDALDLCPDVAGAATNSGCPPTGSADRDGDGVDDGTDLSPAESGPAESGGAPAPGSGTDGDGDGIADADEPTEDPLSGLDLFVPGYLLQFAPFELQALEFQVAQNYSQVYCYASVAGQAMERIGPFHSLSAHRWDIAAVMGPLNSRTFLAPASQPVQVRLECSGIVAGPREAPAGGIGEGGDSEAYFDLGAMTRSHTLANPGAETVTVDSNGGAAGHSFRVKYQICSPSCKTPVLRAPLIALTHGGGQHRLAWAWAGHAYNINGFKVYMNGNYMFALSPRSTNYLFRDLPPCGRRFDIQLTAYTGNPHRPDQESPRSNIATWDGEFCPRTAMVSFERFETGDLRGRGPAPGPIYGSFWAGEERRDFDSTYRVRPNRSHPITDFFPRTDFTVDLGSNDSLYLAARIIDRDPGSNDTMIDVEAILPPAEIFTREYTLTGRGGNKVIVRITVTPRP